MLSEGDDGSYSDIVLNYWRYRRRLFLPFNTSMPCEHNCVPLYRTSEVFFACAEPLLIIYVNL